MEGLILAAGKGSRLSPDMSSEVCKALVRVADTPLIVYSLENLRHLGIEKATIVIGNRHGEIPASLGSDYRGIALQYAVQEQPIGLANAMISASAYLKEDLIFQLSDEIFLQSEIEKILPDGTDPFDFAIGYTMDSAERIRQNYAVELDEQKRIFRCTEKPKTVLNNMKGTGFCYFSRDCYTLLVQNYDPEKNQPNDLCDFMNLLVQNGKTGRAVQIAGEEININTPADLLYAKQRLN